MIFNGYILKIESSCLACHQSVIVLSVDEMPPFEGPRQRNALDILKPYEEGESRPFLDQIWGGLIGSVLGFGLFSFTNYCQRRPVLSGYYIISVQLCDLSIVTVKCQFGF